MEQALDVYKRPYQLLRPVVLMDEAPRQEIRGRRLPLPARSTVEARNDHEDERRGVCNISMAAAWLARRGLIKVVQRRETRAWAAFLDQLPRNDPDAEKLALVMDDLNPHAPGSLHERFPAPEATRASGTASSPSYTLRRGRCLNIAGVGSSVLTRQSWIVASIG